MCDQDDNDEEFDDREEPCMITMLETEAEEADQETDENHQPDGIAYGVPDARGRSSALVRPSSFTARPS